jgi:uncharacterized membrane protein YdjX (TVP38/TMEM64 family)
VTARSKKTPRSEDEKRPATPRHRGKLQHPGVRLAALTIIAAGFLWLTSVYTISPDELRPMIESWGVAAPMAYWALGTGLIVAFVPLAIVCGLAGLFFGTALGFPVALLAAASGASVTFVLSRWLGGSAIDELQGQKVAAMRAWISERGLLAVVVARIAPIPTSVVNYGGGLTTLRLPAFVVGSLLGFMPRVFAYVTVGGSLDDPISPAMIGAVLLLVAVTAVGGLIVRRDRRARTLARSIG